jgi:hypothetical protein
MFRLSVTDMGKDSAKCPPGCQKYNPTGCHACTNRIRTIYKCDHCNTTSAFFGGNDPKKCGVCKLPFPDLYLMKSSFLCVTRIKYHLGINI